ncbi:MAG: hypothetical protein AB1772_09805 [Candidatus Zixiibacteriota bacterium]
MTGKTKSPTDEQLRLLIDSMCVQLGRTGHEAVQVVNTLIRETVKFRDKLKQETGEILTVGDTRIALDALTEHLQGRKMTNGLTPEQKALTQIWIDRLTLFKAL